MLLFHIFICCKELSSVVVNKEGGAPIYVIPADLLVFKWGLLDCHQKPYMVHIVVRAEFGAHRQGHA
jgi:hypothetical protein